MTCYDMFKGHVSTAEEGKVNTELFTPESLGFLRVAVSVPALQVAHIRYNTEMIIDVLKFVKISGPCNHPVTTWP